MLGGNLPKRLLVLTGASGFFGANAIEFLTENKFYDRIIATDLRMPEHPSPLANQVNVFLHHKIEFITADLADRKSLKKLEEKINEAALQGYDIFVWHAGGLFNYSSSRSLLREVNVHGTINLLQIIDEISSRMSLRSRFKRFVFWSGGVAYGDFNHPQGTLPATETYPTVPANDYGWSKLEAEEWAMHFHENSGISVTIMRLGAIYGPYSRYGMGAAIILQAKGQLEPVIVGSGNNKTAMIHAEDVARVAHFLGNCREANGEVYNVVDDTSPTLAEQAICIGREVGNEPFHNFRMPVRVFRFLIWLTRSMSKWLESEVIIDPGLGEIILLNSWMSKVKLMKLAEENAELIKELFPGEEGYLLKHPNTLDGLKQTIGWFREEGWL